MNDKRCKGEATGGPLGEESRPPGHLIPRLAVAIAAAALFITSCTVSPRYRPTARTSDRADSQPTHASTTAGVETPEVVEYARSFIGTPYRTGGASRSGMDCSGLVMTVYQHFDVDLPRRSIDQSRVGRTVPRGDVAPGDLVFFKTSNRNPVTHVGIYVGDGQFIHASTGARKVRIDALEDDYFRRRFVVAKRVLD